MPEKDKKKKRKRDASQSRERSKKKKDKKDKKKKKSRSRDRSRERRRRSRSRSRSRDRRRSRSRSRSRSRKRHRRSRSRDRTRRRSRSRSNESKKQKSESKKSEGVSASLPTEEEFKSKLEQEERRARMKAFLEKKQNADLMEQQALAKEKADLEKKRVEEEKRQDEEMRAMLASGNALVLATKPAPTATAATPTPGANLGAVLKSIGRKKKGKIQKTDEELMAIKLAKLEASKKAELERMAKDEGAADDDIIPDAEGADFEMELMDFKMTAKEFNTDLDASLDAKRLGRKKGKRKTKMKTINVFGGKTLNKTKRKKVKMMVTKVKSTGSGISGMSFLGKAFSHKAAEEEETEEKKTVVKVEQKKTVVKVEQKEKKAEVKAPPGPQVKMEPTNSFIKIKSDPSMPPPPPIPSTLMPPPLPPPIPMDIEPPAVPPPVKQERQLDALDAFMMDVLEEEAQSASRMDEDDDDERFTEDRIYSDEEEISEGELEEGSKRTSWLEKQKQATSKREMKQVDHSQIDYPDFQKRFYIEAPETAGISDEDLKEWRILEECKIRGPNCPKPVLEWKYCGLPARVLAVIHREAWAAPFPIQSQTMPIIMAGRDCIGIAKTGSGKTLAFVLPLLRHVMAQERVITGEGPIGVIMAPTRELTLQIFVVVRKFCKALGLRCAAVYGGGGVAEQIGHMKKGVDVVVATPGRFIDILCANNGRVTNLQRCTFLVLDEADRMFDMGFEPQVSKILENVRPDRQTIMFSATFPRSVEVLAKRACRAPIEILIGGRSVATADVQQIIEVRPNDTKFRRLLAILGKWYQSGNILIFVDQQEKVDQLFRQLIDSGYPCLSLHGGMDQTDRDYTISDYKNKLRTILVATSIVARGLDVKDLVLVINYTVPNHYEDYVHRIGRTGRAGTKGTAITFLEPDQDKYAPDLVKGLKASGQVVPQDLQKMADDFEEKRKRGLVSYNSNSGYGGKGFKFDDAEEKARKSDQHMLRFGGNRNKTDEEKAEGKRLRDEAKEAKEGTEGKDGDEKKKTEKKVDPIAAQLAAAKRAAFAASRAMTNSRGPATIDQVLQAKDKVKAELDKASDIKVDLSTLAAKGTANARAWAIANAIKRELANPTQQSGNTPISVVVGGVETWNVELEINDYPQHSRWIVTHKAGLRPVTDIYDVQVTTKGTHVPPGRKPVQGERKLYLFIEGRTERDVTGARAGLVDLLEEGAVNTSARPQKEQYGRYSVV